VRYPPFFVTPRSFLTFFMPSDPTPDIALCSDADNTRPVDSKLGEFQLIQQFFAEHFAVLIAAQSESEHGVVLGIGDDAALLSCTPGYQLVVTVDTSVVDRHFPADADPYAIAYRALAVNLSDLAAMGARPRWITLALTLPDVDEAWLAAFSHGLAYLCAQHQLMLVGGDTTKGPLSITIQAMGEVEPGRAMCRHGARVGDKIYVTGELGRAHVGLTRWLQGQRPAFRADQALQQARQQARQNEDEDFRAYLYPRARIMEGRIVSGFASACLDISDGLVADLGHICQRSSEKAGMALAANIYVSSLPLADKQDDRQIDAALSGGDDYELCFCVSPEQEAALLRIYQGKVAAPIRCIGEIVAHTAGPDQQVERVSCWDDRTGKLQPYELTQTGYQHF
jgi:thiamine-monophosphate kinase